MSNVGFILFLIFTGLEIIGIILYILLKDWLPKKFRNNITLAWVYVANGDGYAAPIKGRRLVEFHSTYDTYVYKYQGVLRRVDVTEAYPVEYMKGRRLIFTHPASVNPIALPGHTPVKYLESDEAHKMARESVAAAFMAIRKKGFAMSLKMFLIIAAVVVIAGVGIWYYNGHKKAKVPTTPGNQITTPITTPHITITPIPGGK